jgi:hypothetical protein
VPARRRSPPARASHRTPRADCAATSQNRAGLDGCSWSSRPSRPNNRDAGSGSVSLMRLSDRKLWRRLTLGVIVAVVPCLMVSQPSAWASLAGFTLTPLANFAFCLRPHAALSVLLDRELRAAVPSPLLITGGLAIGRDF